VAADLCNLGPAADIGDQGAQGPRLRRGEVIAERVVGIGPMPADQADADRAAIVVDDMRADVGLAPSCCALAVEVDQPVIADGALAPVLHVPAPDFGKLGGEGSVGHPFRPGGAAMQDDLAHGVSGGALEDYRGSGHRSSP
jgi:hypothetical protein